MMKARKALNYAVEDIPVTRRTRGKVIDYKKTAENWMKKKNGLNGDQDY